VRLALTGTPGTGKSTVADLLSEEYDVIHLNDEIREHDLYENEDADRGGSLVADFDAITEWLGDWEDIVDSHLAHYLDADEVVVLRCRPDLLESRLTERGEPPESAAENAESEALDVILSEAVERFGRDRVYEIDTTDQDPESVADDVRAVIVGDREPSAGTVDFTDYL
jgi:adenylate kinase